MPVRWITTTEEHFDEMLGALPPALMARGGFLVGEPSDHRICNVRKQIAPTFAAFVRVGEVCYQAHEPLTVAEFRAAELPVLP